MDEHCASPVPKASQLRSVCLFSKGGANDWGILTGQSDIGTALLMAINSQFIDISAPSDPSL
jgi:hypothetical protein